MSSGGSSFEPPTSAKVIFETTKGPICIEIWAKETPITSRKFISNCLNNTFKNCHFEKVIPNFIIQTSSPTTITNTTTIDKEVVEKHQRLRFNRRGLCGYAGSGQFFITTGNECESLTKYTMFGKVVDNTIFNVMKINDGELDSDGVPLYPTVIKDCQVVIKYFDELVKDEPQQEPMTNSKKKKRKLVKDKNKISFDDEDLQDDAKVDLKSAHELLHKKAKTVEPIQEPVEKPVSPKEDVDIKPKKVVETPESVPEPSTNANVVTQMKSKYKKRGKDRDTNTMNMLTKFLQTEKHNWL